MARLLMKDFSMTFLFNLYLHGYSDWVDLKVKKVAIDQANGPISLSRAKSSTEKISLT